MKSIYTASQVPRAEAGPPADERRTGYVHDTSINPFIVTGEGKELGDPMPVHWDGVWHLYALSADFRMVPHFTSTDLVKWVEHKPAMAGKDICTGTVVRHENKYYLFYTDCGPQTVRLVVSDNPWEFDFSKVVGVPLQIQLGGTNEGNSDSNSPVSGFLFAGTGRARYASIGRVKSSRRIQ